MPRDLPVILSSGQRFTATIDDDVSDDQVTAQLGAVGASLDGWAMRKRAIVGAAPPHLRTVLDLLLPGTPEAALGDLVTAGVGTKAQALARGAGRLARAGARVAGPAAGAATTAVAGELSGDPAIRWQALGMLGAGVGAEGGMAAARYAYRNVAQAGLGEAMSNRLGQAVQRWFPNTGTPKEMVALFRGGGADKIAAERLITLEAAMTQQMGPQATVFVPSQAQVRQVLPRALPGTGGKTPLPLATFGEAYDTLKQLRALRRGALSATEPLKYAEVLTATDALEKDLLNALGSGAPNAIPLFHAIKKQGRQMYAVIDAVKGVDIVTPHPTGGRVDLNPLLEELVAPGRGKREPLLQELVESGAGDFIKGILPEGMTPGTADLINPGSGVFARTRAGVTSGGTFIPFPERRTFAGGPPGRQIPGTVASTPAAQVGGEAARQAGAEEPAIPTSLP